MKYTILGAILLSCQLIGNPMCKKIESMDTTQNEVLIALSDGTTWRWATDIYSETFLQSWEEGDEVIIQQVDHPGLALHNLSHPRYAPLVAIHPSSLETLLQVADIEDGFVTLDDETSWQPAYHSQDFFLRYWQVGDRILITKSLGNDRELINMDLPYTSRSIDMRALAVWPYTPPVEEEEVTEEEIVDEEPIVENSEELVAMEQVEEQ